MPSLPHPVLSVDVVLLNTIGSRLMVLLHCRKRNPFLGVMALPGAVVHMDETLQTAARRALVSKAGMAQSDVCGLYLEQVATFDALFRDPRGRTVSVVHMGLSARRVPCARAAAAAWVAVDEVATGTLPFDHSEILRSTVARLRGKLRYTNIAARLLGDRFRLDELQSVYEAVLGRGLNRSNFRTKLLKIGLIEQVGVAAARVGEKGGRPAHLYRFTHPDIEAQDREFV
jgi:8-oxo-dGTP diphosphatase